MPLILLVAFIGGLIYMVRHALEVDNGGALLAPYAFCVFFAFSPVVLTRAMNMDDRPAMEFFKGLFGIFTIYLVIQIVIFWVRMLVGNV